MRVRSPIHERERSDPRVLWIGTSRIGLRAVELVGCHAQAGTLKCRFSRPVRPASERFRMFVLCGLMSSCRALELG